MSKIYTSGIRGALADNISNGLLDELLHIHSHGGRVHLIQSGELYIDMAFIGVPCCDEFGNANGFKGKSIVFHPAMPKLMPNTLNSGDADRSDRRFPEFPASITQDRVDAVVQVAEVGDLSKIGGDATRMTTNPRELLIAKRAAEVIEHSGYF